MGYSKSRIIELANEVRRYAAGEGLNVADGLYEWLNEEPTTEECCRLVAGELKLDFKLGRYEDRLCSPEYVANYYHDQCDS